MSLASRTRALLEQALDAYRDSPRAVSWLRRQLDRLDDPLRLAVAGPRRSGKSTMVNAIAGAEVAGPGAGLSWFRAAPSRSRNELTLIDTPPVDEESSATAIENIYLEADAVLFLVRHPHRADLGFLRAMRDHPIARATAVNAIVVLSRADELGGGRVDAVISTRHVARRYRREPEVRELCQDVVPVAGLLGCAGRTLRQPEFDALAGLARVPRAELAPQLMSADRFIAPDPSLRGGLLERFGLFGVRLALTLIRRGAQSLPALAAQLVPRSGLAELRDAVDQAFVERQPVLKARAALLGLDVVLRMEPRPASATLAAELERTLASAHDFRELRLLAALRTGRTELPPGLLSEAVRLLGGHGTSTEDRLGGHSEDEIFETIRRWRAFAEDPASGAGDRRAAAVVLRSCEELVSRTR